MAVKTQEKAAAKVQKYIELHGHKRLVMPDHRLFESGIAYPVNEAQLVEFLSFESEPGKRPFRVYQEPKKAPEVAQKVEGISVPVAALPKPTGGEVKPSNIQPTKIEVGSDAELAEAGVEVPGEGVVEV